MWRYRYRAKLVRCVDGDTVDLAVDVGFYMTARIRARLLGVDTPERGHDDFAYATGVLRDLIEVVTDDEGYMRIKTTKADSFGRWLVEIGLDGLVNNVMAERWPYER